MPKKRRHSNRIISTRECKKSKTSSNLRQNRDNINYDESGYELLDYLDESEVIEISSDDKSEEIAIVECANVTMFKDIAGREYDDIISVTVDTQNEGGNVRNKIEIIAEDKVITEAEGSMKVSNIGVENSSNIINNPEKDEEEGSSGDVVEIVEIEENNNSSKDEENIIPKGIVDKTIAEEDKVKKIENEKSNDLQENVINEFHDLIRERINTRNNDKNHNNIPILYNSEENIKDSIEILNKDSNINESNERFRGKKIRTSRRCFEKKDKIKEPIKKNEANNIKINEVIESQKNTRNIKNVKKRTKINIDINIENNVQKYDSVKDSDIILQKDTFLNKNDKSSLDVNSKDTGECSYDDNNIKNGEDNIIEITNSLAGDKCLKEFQSHNIIRKSIIDVNNIAEGEKRLKALQSRNDSGKRLIEFDNLIGKKCLRDLQCRRKSVNNLQETQCFRQTRGSLKGLGSSKQIRQSPRKTKKSIIETDDVNDLDDDLIETKSPREPNVSLKEIGNQKVIKSTSRPEKVKETIIYREEGDNSEEYSQYVQKKEVNKDVTECVKSTENLRESMEIESGKSDISAVVSDRGTISLSGSDTVSSLRSGKYYRFEIERRKSHRQRLEKMYIVEKILGMRDYNGVRQFYLKWEGFPDTANSWEPEENINSTDIIMEYLAELERKENNKITNNEVLHVSSNDQSTNIVQKDIEDDQNKQKSTKHQMDTEMNTNINVTELKNENKNDPIDEENLKVVKDSNSLLKRTFKKKNKRDLSQKYEQKEIEKNAIDLTCEDMIKFNVQNKDDTTYVGQTTMCSGMINECDLIDSIEFESSKKEINETCKFFKKIKTRNSVAMCEKVGEIDLTLDEEINTKLSDDYSCIVETEILTKTSNINSKNQDIVDVVYNKFDLSKCDYEKTINDSKDDKVDLTMEDEDSKECEKVSISSYMMTDNDKYEEGGKLSNSPLDKNGSILDETTNSSDCVVVKSVSSISNHENGADNGEESSKLAESVNEIMDGVIAESEDEASKQQDEDVHSQRSDEVFSKETRNNSKTSLNNLNTYFPENLPQNVQEIFQVEKILRMRFNRGMRYFYLKWEGFPDSENSWEPEENLECPELIEEFLKDQRKLRTRKPDKKFKRFSLPIEKSILSETKKKKSLVTPSNKSVMLEKLPDEVKIKEPAVKPRGFPKEREAEIILGSGIVNEELNFLIKWKNIDMANLVPAKRANIECPQTVIRFYERNLTWENLDGSITTTPDEKITVLEETEKERKHRIESKKLQRKSMSICQQLLSKATASPIKTVRSNNKTMAAGIMQSRKLTSGASRMLNIINSFQSSRRKQDLKAEILARQKPQMLPEKVNMHKPMLSDLDDVIDSVVDNVLTCQYDSRDIPREASPPLQPVFQIPSTIQSAGEPSINSLMKMSEITQASQQSYTVQAQLINVAPRSNITVDNSSKYMHNNLVINALNSNVINQLATNPNGVLKTTAPKGNVIYSRHRVSQSSILPGPRSYQLMQNTPNLSPMPVSKKPISNIQRQSQALKKSLQCALPNLSQTFSPLSYPQNIQPKQNAVERLIDSRTMSSSSLQLQLQNSSQSLIQPFSVSTTLPYIPNESPQAHYNIKYNQQPIIGTQEQKLVSKQQQYSTNNQQNQYAVTNHQQQYAISNQQQQQKYSISNQQQQQYSASNQQQQKYPASNQPQQQYAASNQQQYTVNNQQTPSVIIYQNQYVPNQYQYVMNNNRQYLQQALNSSNTNSYSMPTNLNQLYYSPQQMSQVAESSPRHILPRNSTEFSTPPQNSQMPTMVDSQSSLQIQQNNQLLRNSYLNLGAFL